MIGKNLFDVNKYYEKFSVVSPKHLFRQDMLKKISLTDDQLEQLYEWLGEYANSRDHYYFSITYDKKMVFLYENHKYIDHLVLK